MVDFFKVNAISFPISTLTLHRKINCLLLRCIISLLFCLFCLLSHCAGLPLASISMKNTQKKHTKNNDSYILFTREKNCFSLDQRTNKQFYANVAFICFEFCSYHCANLCNLRHLVFLLWNSLEVFLFSVFRFIFVSSFFLSDVLLVWILLIVLEPMRWMLSFLLMYTK